MFFGIRYFLIKRQKYTTLRKTLLLMMLVFYMITELGRSFYRPFIYTNNIDDFFIADTLGSSFGTLTMMYMVILMVGKSNFKDLYLMIGIILGLMLYEVSAIGRASYDSHDMIAIGIFGFIGLISYYCLVKSKINDNPSKLQPKQNTTQKV